MRNLPRKLKLPCGCSENELAMTCNCTPQDGICRKGHHWTHCVKCNSVILLPDIKTFEEFMEHTPTKICESCK